MRKFNIGVVLAILFTGLFYLAGCDGDEGPVGPKGIKGRKGDPGTDTEVGPPSSRHFAIGVTNSHRYAVNGDISVFVTFDSTVRANRDTVVAGYVTTPPLIDGNDGEEVEWGPQKSRLRLAALNTASGYKDNEIYEVACRAAWDENYIYTFFQWKERKVTVRVTGGDSTVFDAGASDQPHQLYFDAQSKRVDKIEGNDTTFFQWIRKEVLDVKEKCDTIILFPGQPPIIICRPDTLFGDTNFVWLQQPIDEDKLAMFWCDEEFDGWSQYAFQEFFGVPGNATGSNDALIDAWVWGSGTTNPVNTADDWYLIGSSFEPDAGAPPFIDNFVVPDSVPLYQSFRDPNYKSTANLLIQIYPFWYFDAVGYAYNGWDIYRAVYVPGIVTTLPSDSRADVYARGVFDGGTGVWTVEMRRARHTYSGDDVKF